MSKRILRALRSGFGGSVSLVFFRRFVSATIIELLRAFDLRVRHDAFAADAAEVLDALEAAALHEFSHSGKERLDDIRPDGLIEHCRGANLHGSAAKEEIAERVVKV